jgi:hypothetical protein
VTAGIAGATRRWIRLRRNSAPGVDPHVSYVTTLTKTSVEIMNVQLLAAESRELHSTGAGGLLIAMSELNLSHLHHDGNSDELRRAKGEVHWLPAPGAGIQELGEGASPLCGSGDEVSKLLIAIGSRAFHGRTIALHLLTLIALVMSGS